MKKHKQCVLCTHRVGNGNRHAAGHCPPLRKPGENRRARNARGRRGGVRVGQEAPARGVPIANTGVPAGPAKG